VTSYHLRGASPAKTRADAVVVGALQTSKGVTLADGGEDVAEAFGRALRPLLSTLGFSGKSGEVARVPTGGRLASPLLVLVGMGAPVDDRAAALLSVRRAAGVAARSTSNAASVALALPAGDAALVRNVTEGYLLGAYTFSRYLSKSPDKAAGTVSVLSPAARRAEATTAFEEAQVVAGAVGAVRDWVNTPANDQRSPPRPRARRSGSRFSTRRSWPSSAVAVSSASAAARAPRPGWSSSATPLPSRSPTSPSSGRASPSTPAVSPSSPAPPWTP
jgi:leucyl aminopeptidase